MIAFLKGDFIYKSPSKIIIDVHDVGYEVQISLLTYQKISIIEKGSLFIYQHITENTQSLYGFFTQMEKDLFLLLITVNGIGANTARIMLSGLSPQDIVNAISLGNIGALEQIKGIGKKTAERLIVELKDKVNRISLDQIHQTPNNINSNKMEAIQALVALGISKNNAEKGVIKAWEVLDDKSNLENLIKLALKNC
ncbi:MAG: Holliday junction branch migration protein RuvA [Sediminibacterium sp.]|nr:Holliday junction branch migration protein RuvA [Sediminibacterium sp.]